MPNVSARTSASRAPAATLALLVAAGGLVAPPAAAEPTPPQTALDLYLSAEGLSPAPPASEESAAFVAVDPATLPLSGATFPTALIVDFGSYEFPVDTTITTSGVLTVFVTADTASFITDIRAFVYDEAGDEVASGRKGPFVGSTVSTSTSTPGQTDNQLRPGRILKYELGIPLAGTDWAAGDALTLSFWMSAVSAAGTPTEVKILYNSTKHPSRLAFGVDTAGPAAAPNLFKFLYLAQDGLAKDAPVAEESLKRATASDGQCAQGTCPPQFATMATAGQWTWGSFVLDEDFTPTGDMLATVWVTLDGSPGAAVIRALRVHARFTLPGEDDAIVREQDMGVRPTAFNSQQPSTLRLNLGVNMTGLTLPAGTTLELRFSTWSTDESPGGAIVLLYGSAAHPASLMFEVAGAAPAAPPEPETEPEPGNGTVEPSPTPSPSPTASAEPSASPSASEPAGTPQGESPQASEEPGSTPGFGAALLLGALAAGLLAARRRR